MIAFSNALYLPNQATALSPAQNINSEYVSLLARLIADIGAVYTKPPPLLMRVCFSGGPTRT
jgi:hypothetical protein